MIYVFLANGFEEIEALGTVDILRRAELSVTTVGIGGRRVTGAHGITVEADVSEDDTRVDAVEAIVLPGGMPGTLHLEASPTVQAFLQLAVRNDWLIGAICAAPSILGHKGWLRGRRATCFPGFEQTLEGAEVCTDLVVQDGRIVTGRGPGAVMPFALKLAELLASGQKAAAIRASLQGG